MIEYLYSTIRAGAGDAVTISAKITDDAGAVVTDSCTMCLYDGSEKVLDVEGTLNNDSWDFFIDGNITAALAGRYWYKICDCNHNGLDFMQPIYFVTRGKKKQDFEAGREFELAKLVKPQAELRAAIEERGAVITDEEGIDTYAAHLRSCPYIATGTFTPEADTAEFSVRGLPFEPTQFLIYTNERNFDLTKTGSVIKAILFKDDDSQIRYCKTANKVTNALLPVEAAGTWFDFYTDGAIYCVPAASCGNFRAGVTYNYTLA